MAIRIKQAQGEKFRQLFYTMSQTNSAYIHNVVGGVIGFLLVKRTEKEMTPFAETTKLADILDQPIGLSVSTWTGEEDETVDRERTWRAELTDLLRQIYYEFIEEILYSEKGLQHFTAPFIAKYRASFADDEDFQNELEAALVKSVGEKYFLHWRNDWIRTFADIPLTTFAQNSSETVEKMLGEEQRILEDVEQKQQGTYVIPDENVPVLFEFIKETYEKMYEKPLVLPITEEVFATELFILFLYLFEEKGYNDASIRKLAILGPSHFTKHTLQIINDWQLETPLALD